MLSRRQGDRNLASQLLSAVQLRPIETNRQVGFTLPYKALRRISRHPNSLHPGLPSLSICEQGKFSVPHKTYSC